MTVVTLDLATWALIGGTLVPLIVGLVTKLRASSAVKGLANLVLSAVAGVIAAAIAGGGILTKQSVVAGFLSLVGSVGAYYGVLKPTGVTGAIQVATADIGLGSASAKPNTGATLARP